MIHFIGTSFAPRHLKLAAVRRYIPVTDNIEEADCVFISEDTPTDDGHRDLSVIYSLIYETVNQYRGTLVLTSQVPPGFTRSLNLPIYHMAETLRVKDAEVRAYRPEQFIVGCKDPSEDLPESFKRYLRAFECPVFKMTYEEAEFSKIAINMTLASQVENANRLSEVAKKLGCEWDNIKTVLEHDKRIGKYSYLTPGDWRQSSHLLRDWVTLQTL